MCSSQSHSWSILSWYFLFHNITRWISLFGVFRLVLFGIRKLWHLLFDTTVWNNILKCFHSSENTHTHTRAHTAISHPSHMVFFSSWTCCCCFSLVHPWKPSSPQSVALSHFPPLRLSFYLFLSLCLFLCCLHSLFLNDDTERQL